MPLLSAPYRATPTPQEYLTSKGFEARDLPSCKKYLKMVGEHELRRPVPVFTAATAILGGGLHSSTFQLNLSRVCHKKTPYTP